MKQSKAIKHLNRAREDREFWRQAYVENERGNGGILDVYSSYYGCTLREKRRADYIANIKELNERISRYERFAK